MAKDDVLTLKFSREALEAFIEIINEARLVRDGQRLVVSYREYEPGSATLTDELKSLTEV